MSRKLFMRKTQHGPWSLRYDDVSECRPYAVYEDSRGYEIGHAEFVGQHGPSGMELVFCGRAGEFGIPASLLCELVDRYCEFMRKRYVG
jgi:hypothetical protein